MFDNIQSLSTEKFAAFLDGNLPAAEMTTIKELANQDGVIHDLVSANENIESYLSKYLDSGIQVPAEILSDNFELPSLSDNAPLLDFTSILPLQEFIDTDAVANEQPSISELVALQPENTEIQYGIDDGTNQFNDDITSKSDSDNSISFDEI